MKFIKNILFLATLAMLAISCDNLEGTTANPDKFVSPVMNDNSTIVIDQTNKDVENVTFTWSPADFGYQAAITYNVYGVYASGEPFLIGTSTSPSLSIKKNELNSKLCLPVDKGGQGAPENEMVTMSVYVVASVAESFSTLTSASKIVSVSTTTAVVIKASLYTPGDYQGWAPATAPQIWETNVKKIFEGFIGLYINGDETDLTSNVLFKFASQPNWDGPNYGSTYGDETTLLSGGTMTFSNDGGAKNHYTAPGFYHFYDINTEALTGKYERFDGLVVVGAFNGWNNGAGTAMTYDVSTNTWSASVDFSGGDLEFLILPQVGGTGDWNKKFARAADGGISFGSGDNLLAPDANTYTLTLNFNVYPYELTFKK